MKANLLDEGIQDVIHPTAVKTLPSLSSAMSMNSFFVGYCPRGLLFLSLTIP